MHWSRFFPTASTVFCSALSHSDETTDHAKFCQEALFALSGGTVGSRGLARIANFAISLHIDVMTCHGAAERGYRRRAQFVFLCLQ